MNKSHYHYYIIETHFSYRTWSLLFALYQTIYLRKMECYISFILVFVCLFLFNALICLFKWRLASKSKINIGNKQNCCVWSSGEWRVPLTEPITPPIKVSLKYICEKQLDKQWYIPTLSFHREKLKNEFTSTKLQRKLKTGVKSKILDLWSVLFPSKRHEDDSGLDSDNMIYGLYQKFPGGRDSGIYCCACTCSASGTYTLLHSLRSWLKFIDW